MDQPPPGLFIAMLMALRQRRILAMLSAFSADRLDRLSGGAIPR